MDFFWDESGTATALATTLLAVFTFSAFVLACFQLGVLVRNSNRQTRPYVYADVVPGLQGMGCWDLVVENMGRSTAVDVKIDLDPLPKKSHDDGFAERLRGFVEHSHTLPPGTRKLVMWRMDRNEENQRTELGASEKTKIKVTYMNDRGRSYSDLYLIDLTGYGPAVPLPFVGSQREGEDHDLYNINKRLEAINIHLGALRRGK